jgi:hypothetical protein
MQELLIVCFAATAATAEPSPPATNAADVSGTASAYVQSSEQTYRLPLALAYITPLSFQVATWLVPSLESGPYTGLGLVGMLAAPFIVHAAHDNSSGALFAELGIISSLVGGAAAGASLLVASGHDVCRDCDDGIGEVFSRIYLGGVVGAGVGYLTWAVVDTVLHARVTHPAQPRPPRALDVHIIRPSIELVTAYAGTSRPRPSGFSLGLIGEF